MSGGKEMAGNSVWRAIADGKLPAVLDVTKWIIREADLLLFAKHLTK